ncbi:hypothetical protein ILUMI_08980 [Ignelater luminosus]|uniref:Uncharacterized protein n=1 Tax=Ignelater luminosus TaxID=2038154 RepID=A0A8K0GEY7_IGNLU|nr:hypothetical protein ILUMI_08980 [Ignelater luminosus]
MQTCEIDLLGLCEIKWPEEGHMWSGEFRIINTAANNGNGGVGILMKKEIGQKVKRIYTIAICVYMPTTDHKEEDVDNVYEGIEEAIKYAKGEENLIIMGEQAEEKVAEAFGLGRRNERGNRLIQFCPKHKMTIANTLFQ